ncbi:hypothetical protein BJX61DRAFT_547898 [Aspergillus egyptiacus]|nr:hypothetical protein BJX61DRAFT_547898 [Aspergillus egyptiacus]
MKPLPFPFPLNIGTDIVHLPRISRLLARPGYLARFTRRILADPEQRDFRTRFSLPVPVPVPDHPDPDPNRSHTNPIHVSADMTRWLAGRFAAKEAARKAAPRGAGSLGWKDVVVRVGNGVGAGEAEGRPEVVFLKGYSQGEDQVEEGRVGKLSISHDGEYVVAMVLAAG